jgi:hypothetical protein
MSTSPNVHHDPAPGQDYVRNNWWSIPGGCLLLLVLFIVSSVGVLALIQFSLSRSGAYRQAIERTRANPSAVSELGSPIHAGWFTSGNVKVYGNTGDAQLIIPVAGSQNHGTIFVIAHKEQGPWQFSTLQLAVAGRKQRIDLLQPAPDIAPARDF